jgi:hypothetical protein
MTNALDYWPVEQRLASQIHGLAGGVWTQWATGNFWDYWGTPDNWANASPEKFGVEVIDGRAWLTLLGFQQIEPPKNLWLIKTIQANIYVGGVRQSLLPPLNGQPYVLLSFIPHSIEVWGTVADSVPFYWRAWYTGPTPTANPWQGTRPAIEQSEVWWDRNGGWTRGGPSPKDALPFRPGTLIPQPIMTESAWFQTLGERMGMCYTMGDIMPGGKRDVRAATKYHWPY